MVERLPESNIAGMMVVLAAFAGGHGIAPDWNDDQYKRAFCGLQPES
jgi:hypothetical protein